LNYEAFRLEDIDARHVDCCSTIMANKQLAQSQRERLRLLSRYIKHSDWAKIDARHVNCCQPLLTPRWYKLVF
jgi:hypothetical protein